MQGMSGPATVVGHGVDELIHSAATALADQVHQPALVRAPLVPLHPRSLGKACSGLPRLTRRTG
jgi:hypothetical protein